MSAIHLNGFSGFGLGVFAVVNFCVVQPLYIPLPKWTRSITRRLLLLFRISSKSDFDDEKPWRLPLTLETAPPLGVLLLLITTTIHGSTIRLGVVGGNGVRPYDVLVLFICLAYISLALDATGALRAMAFWVSQKGGKNGSFLYLWLYLFFFLSGTIIGNDPIILSGTAFLAYFTKVCGISPPDAFIFAEFWAANTASAVLVSSNPTNVLVASAFDLNFLTGFTKYTILPSVASAAITFPVIFLMFKWIAPASIPKQLIPPDVNPRTALVDPAGAWFHGILLLVTLGTLVGTSFVAGGKVHVWMVTLPAGIVSLSRDLIYDFSRQPKIMNDAKQAQAEDAKHSPATENGNTPASDDDSPPALEPKKSEYPPKQALAMPQKATLLSSYRKFALHFPTTSTTLGRLPLPLLPFAVGEFILVQGLGQLGWISVFAKGFARVCTTPASTVFFTGFITAAVFCPFFGTNIGATIFMVELVRDTHFVNAPAAVADPRIVKMALYAVALGSNLGAFSFTFAGSLAGLLWRDILKQRGIIVTAKQFFFWNLVPLLLQTTVACAVILAELHWLS